MTDELLAAEYYHNLLVLSQTVPVSLTGLCIGGESRSLGDWLREIPKQKGDGD